MKYFYLLALCCFVQFANASVSPNHGFWCSGQVKLDNNEVLEGDISYNLKFDALQVKAEGITKTFTAENIASFEIFDPIKYRHRKYVAIDYAMDEGYKRKTFFEVLADGELTILRKSKYVRRPRVTEDFRAPHIYLNVVCRHTYYVYRDGKFTEVEDFQNQVIPMMSSHRRQVNEYVERCNLRLREIHEQMRVVNLYNQLASIDHNKKLLTKSLAK